MYVYAEWVRKREKDGYAGGREDLYLLYFECLNVREMLNLKQNNKKQTYENINQ